MKDDEVEELIFSIYGSLECPQSIVHKHSNAVPDQNAAPKASYTNTLMLSPIRTRPLRWGIEPATSW